MSIDPQAAREKILATVRELARQCWEYVGLDRSALVDEFEFTQQDIAAQAACTPGADA